MIWNKPYTPDDLESLNSHMPAFLGIDIAEIGDDYIVATMPVNERTQMPLGFLHGGASCVLAETVGSIASHLCLDPQKYRAAGVEINASHLRGVRGGLVTAVCRPIRVGRTTHVWDIRITGDDDKPVCVSRLSVAVVPLRR